MKKDDLFLKVFIDKSEFIDAYGGMHTFQEGKTSLAAKERYRKIVENLKLGFLEKKIDTIKSGVDLSKISLTERQKEYISRLVNSITSEIGRAIVAITVLQLVVKTISPEQSIRLHKGSERGEQFSWKEGISMRVLDKNFITPVLRKHNLIKLNADGFMMTRSLAENYPYSLVYKAKLRGARNEWLLLIEDLESNHIKADDALLLMLSLLINKADDFIILSDSAIHSLHFFFSRHKKINLNDVTKLILRHINESDHAARLMEIAMHSLLQGFADLDLMEEELVPLSQMRSANKKHGNIGDIEMMINDVIVEAWDAKYGKSYLRDELEELIDKLKIQHEVPAVVGFVTTEIPDLKRGIQEKIDEMGLAFGCKVLILEFNKWIERMVDRPMQKVTETVFARSWLQAYTESIAQKRRGIAPIDEPCFEWLKSLMALIETT